MSLFFVAYASDHQPMLIDAEDEAKAFEIGRHVSEGEAPSQVMAIPPNVFVAGLFSEPEEEDDVYTCVDPLPHVEEYLAKIDAAIGGSSLAEVKPTCGSVAEHRGEDVRCELEHEHDDEHEGTTSAGEVARWT